MAEDRRLALLTWIRAGKGVASAKMGGGRGRLLDHSVHRTLTPAPSFNSDRQL